MGESLMGSISRAHQVAGSTPTTPGIWVRTNRLPLCRPLPDRGSDRLPPWSIFPENLPTMTLNPFTKRVGRSKETQFLHVFQSLELPPR